MKNIAIIAEYNPFHNGHKHQINRIYEIFGEDINIVIIMSGNFVQRGDFAIFDKHTRAKSAVMHGADLVLELPLPYSISSAEFFAKGAIHVLNSLNCIDYLCFGSECGDISILNSVCDILVSQEFQESVKHFLSIGNSYPKSLDLALIPYSLSHVIKNPNNTLGIEYIKALKLSNSLIKPITITRLNVGHHCKTEVCNMASASYIRQNIQNDIAHLVPCTYKDSPVFIKNVENSILSYLKRKDTSYFANIRDVCEGLEYRIVSALKISTSLEDLYENIKSKRYTKSRIRRIILNAYLNIPKKYTDILPKYTKVLAFNDKGRQVLKTCKKTCKIQIITKPSAPNVLDCDDLLNLDNLSTDLYNMARQDCNLRVSSKEKTTSPIYTV